MLFNVVVEFLKCLVSTKSISSSRVVLIAKLYCTRDHSTERLHHMCILEDRAHLNVLTYFLETTEKKITKYTNRQKLSTNKH